MKARMYDVVVIGAGVVGTATAFALARRGLSVAILDRGEPGRGASFGNAGHIASEEVEPLASLGTLAYAARTAFWPMRPLRVGLAHGLRSAGWIARFLLACRPSAFARGTDALGRLLEKAVPAMEDALAAANARDLLFKRGNYFVAETAAGLRALESDASRLAAHGVAVVSAKLDDIRTAAPWTAHWAKGGVYFSQSAHVADPYRVVQAFLAGAIRAGAVLERFEVEHLDTSADGVALSGGGRRIAAAHAVIACGARSGRLAADVGDFLPMQAERGYHLTFDPAPVALDRPLLAYERRVFFGPMSCGLRITGFSELALPDAPPTEKLFAVLAHHFTALTRCPAPANASSWCGERPSLPDFLPAIGRSPRNSRVIYACGHQHLGLTLSAATADIVARLIVEHDERAAVPAFRPGRFG